MNREEILNEIKNISIKADDLCEHIFDLKIAILGNWRKVTDGVLPKVSGYIIAVYDVNDSIEGRSRVVHEVFYDAEEKKFFGLHGTELDIIAWMDFPKYEVEE